MMRWKIALTALPSSATVEREFSVEKDILTLFYIEYIDQRILNGAKTLLLSNS